MKYYDAVATRRKEPSEVWDSFSAIHEENVLCDLIFRFYFPIGRQILGGSRRFNVYKKHKEEAPPVVVPFRRLAT